MGIDPRRNHQAQFDPVVTYLPDHVLEDAGGSDHRGHRTRAVRLGGLARAVRLGGLAAVVAACQHESEGEQPGEASASEALRLLAIMRIIIESHTRTIAPPPDPVPSHSSPADQGSSMRPGGQMAAVPSGLDRP